MFEVKVTVELPGIPEAINNLADVMRGKIVAPANVEPIEKGKRGKKEKQEAAPAPVTPVPVEQPEQAPPMVEVPETAPAPVPAPMETPAPMEAAPAPVEAPAPVAEAPAKKYNFKQISQAGAALCADLNKMDALITLLNSKYGVAAITMIDESRYNELAEDLIGLGAVIEED